MTRLLPLAALALAALLSAAVGAAASLAATSNGLGAGAAVVGSCATAADVTVSYGADGGGMITSVGLALPAACDGGAVSITLHGAAGPIASAGPVAVVPTPATTTLDLSPVAPSGEVTATDLVITQP